MPDETAERLWLTEPQRKTCLARVTKRRGRRFALDRALFRPKDTDYRHRQRADLGTIWVDGGDKHELASVFARGGEVWHRIDAPAPPVGTKIQCHLDQDRRELDSRVHTAMHLFLAAVHAMDGPPLAADPAVKGGGRFRVELATWRLDPEALAAWLERANQYIAQDVPVTRAYVPRDALEHKVDRQQFAEDGAIYPGPEGSLEVVEIEGICAYPCDGTHAERTGDLEELIIRDTHVHDDGRVVLVGEVPKPGRY